MSKYHQIYIHFLSISCRFKTISSQNFTANDVQTRIAVISKDTKIHSLKDISIQLLRHMYDLTQMENWFG